MDGHEGNGTDEQVAGSRENGAAVQTGTEEPREEEPAKMKSRWADESIDMDSPGFDPIIGKEPDDDMSLDYCQSMSVGSLSATGMLSGRRTGMGFAQADKCRPGCSLYVCNPEPHLTRDDLVRFFHPLRVCIVEFCPDGRALVVFERLEDCRHGLQAYQRRRPERGTRELFLVPAGNALMDSRSDSMEQYHRRGGGSGGMSGDLGGHNNNSFTRMSSMRDPRERGMLMNPALPFEPARRMMPEPPPEDRHAAAAAAKWEGHHGSPFPSPHQTTRVSRRKSPDFGDIRREPSRKIVEPPAPPQANVSTERPRLNIRSQSKILEDTHGVARDPKIFGDTCVEELKQADPQTTPAPPMETKSTVVVVQPGDNGQVANTEVAAPHIGLKKATSRDIFGCGKPQDVFEYERRRQAVDGAQRPADATTNGSDVGHGEQSTAPQPSSARRDSSRVSVSTGPPTESREGSRSRVESTGRLEVEQEHDGTSAGESESGGTPAITAKTTVDYIERGRKPPHVRAVQAVSIREIETEAAAEVQKSVAAESSTRRAASSNIFGVGKPQDDQVYQKRKELERQHTEEVVAASSKGILGPAPAASTAVNQGTKLDGHRLDSVDAMKAAAEMRTLAAHHDDPFVRRPSCDVERVGGGRQAESVDCASVALVGAHSDERRETHTAPMGYAGTVMRGGSNNSDPMRNEGDASGQMVFRRKFTVGAEAEVTEEPPLLTRPVKQHSIIVKRVEAVSALHEQHALHGRSGGVPQTAVSLPSGTCLLPNNTDTCSFQSSNHNGNNTNGQTTATGPIIDAKPDAPWGGWAAPDANMENMQKTECRSWKEVGETTTGQHVNRQQWEAPPGGGCSAGYDVAAEGVCGRQEATGGRLVEVYRADEATRVEQAHVAVGQQQQRQRVGDHNRADALHGRGRKDDRRKRHNAEGGGGDSSGRVFARRQQNEEEDNESVKFRGGGGGGGNFRTRGGGYGWREPRRQHREDKREDHEIKGGTPASSEGMEVAQRSDVPRKGTFDGDGVTREGSTHHSAESSFVELHLPSAGADEDASTRAATGGGGQYDNYKGGTPRGFRWEPTGGRGVMPGRGGSRRGGMEHGGRRAVLDERGDIDNRRDRCVGVREVRPSPRCQGSNGVERTLPCGVGDRPVYHREPSGRTGGGRGGKAGSEGLYRRREFAAGAPGGEGGGGGSVATESSGLGDGAPCAPPPPTTTQPEKDAAIEENDSKEKVEFPSIPRRAILGRIEPVKVQTKNRFATLDSSDENSDD
eukprot:GHVS01011929.1.p1 GENE.GHVS01011929.1~~GHVS01011929.1.p1  ORF type:complete len:1262 (+),score=246.57 GHVS01011929.1:186-3971(+)